MKRRLAVLQFHYRLAFQDEGWTPLEEPLGTSSKANGYLDDWVARSLDGLPSLRERIRRAYCDQLSKRLQAVLKQCSAWEVAAVVLPEYSVPWELLPELGRIAPNILIVAGTHTVSRAALKSEVYAQLEWAKPPVKGSAVCPVLYQGKLVGLQPKLTPAPNLEPHLVLGETWAPIEVFNATMRMGILICIDFLYRDNDAHRSHVAHQLDQCEFLAVPSFSNARSVTEFNAEFDTEAKRYKRPVLYCNSAEFGGTTIRADARLSGTSFPDAVGTLSLGEEGLIVADVDFTRIAAGPSTEFCNLPVLTPYACASFVYSGSRSDASYADWLRRLQLHQDEASLSSFIEQNPPPTKRGSRGRDARLSRLLSSVEELSFERMLQLTREIVLPADVVPLAQLNQAAARGTADQLWQWVSSGDASLTELTIAEGHLRTLGMASRSDRLADWEESGRAKLETIAQEVRGTAPLRDPSMVEIAPIGIYQEVADGQFSKAHQGATELFKKQDYVAAAMDWGKLAEAAHKLVRADPTNAKNLEWETKFRFNRAAALFNTQDFEAAREEVERLDERWLSAEATTNLGIMFLHLGLRERAVLLREKAAHSGADTRELEQHLALHDGALTIPSDASPGVKLELSRRVFDLGGYDKAAGLALEAMAVLEENDQLRIAAVSTLLVSLHATLFEYPAIGHPIPRAQRAMVLESIASGLANLRAQDSVLPTRLRLALKDLETVHAQLVMDSTATAEMVESGALERAPAWQLAASGDLSGALASLERRGSELLYRLQRAELLADFATHEEALLEVEPFRGNGPVEYFRAQVLFFRGDLAAALEAAELAYAEFPIARCQRFLAKVLVQLGKTKQAWALLDKFRTARDTQTLETLARAAEVEEPALASEYWTSYLKASPNDWEALVRFAIHLWRQSEFTRAATLGADALKRFGNALSAVQIYRCARLQLDGVEKATRTQRIEDALNVLERRFVGDPHVEALRLGLIELIDPSYESHVVDSELLTSAGLAFVADLDDFKSWKLLTAEWDNKARQLYREGNIALRTLCRALGTPQPLEIIRRASTPEPEFCAPIMALGANADLRLTAGDRVLLSATELYLLAFLGTLDRLKEAVVGGQLRVLLEPGTRGEVWEDHAQLGATQHTEPSAYGLVLRVREFVAWLLTQDNTAEASIDVAISVPAAKPNLDARIVENFLRAPLQRQLAVLSLMDQDDVLVRVTSDLVGCDLFVGTVTAQALQWDRDTLRTLSLKNSLARTRNVSLPYLLRQLFRGDALRELLVRLAHLGFSDALGPNELEWLLRRRSPDALGQLFKGSDWIAREQSHICHESANQARLNSYVETVWKLLEPRPTISAEATTSRASIEREEQAAATAILEAVEAMDPERRTGVLQRFVLLLGVASVPQFARFYSRRSDDYYELDTEQPASLFWKWLADWAALRLERRRAVVRGLQDALIYLDQQGPLTGLLQHQSAPLVFAAQRLAEGGDSGFGLHEPTGQTIAIVSSTWSDKPFAKRGILVEKNGQPVGELEYEATLQHAAGILGRAPNLETDGALLEFVMVVEGQKVAVALPLEGAFLRMDEERLKAGAVNLAAIQGPLDGRLYKALVELQVSPTVVARKRYAQLAATALFRRVRHDPAFLTRWPTTRDAAFVRPTRETLRQILSEPDDIAGNKRLFDLIGERFASGAWATRSDRTTLALWATEVPGEMSSARAWQTARLPSFAERVDEALTRMSRSETQPICRLAADIFLLRACVSTHPVVQLSDREVDLRLELPGHLLRLLRAEVARGSNRGQDESPAKPDEAPHRSIASAPVAPVMARVAREFADCEPLLLRVCAQVVRALAEPKGQAFETSPKQELWLIYRLYQWLCRQLDNVRSSEERTAALESLIREAGPPTENVADAFDPQRFGTGAFRYRLAVLLHAIGSIGFEKEAGSVRPRTVVGSTQLEDELALLASQPAEVDLPTVFDWFAPLNIPALALSALLVLNPAAVDALNEKAQLDWIGRIPRSFDAAPLDHQFVWLQLTEAMAGSPKVGETARSAHLERIRALSPGPIADDLREVALVLLFESGLDELHSEARLAIHQRIARQGRASALLGRFLCGVTRVDGNAIEPELDAALAAIPTGEQSNDVALELVAVALGILVTTGAPEGRERAREILVRVAQRPEFSHDPRLKELVGFLRGRML